MGTTYTAAQRKGLRKALERGGPVRCPVCGAPVVGKSLPPQSPGPYVRRRIWLTCTDCRRNATLDLPPAGGLAAEPDDPPPAV